MTGIEPRPDVVSRFAPYWHATVIDRPQGGEVGELPEAFVCAACGEARVEAVGSGGFGSMAGGATWYEVHCTQCGVFTEYCHEWG